MSDEPDSKEPVSDKRSVREYETNFLKEKQDAVPRPPRSLCGLALSGGGLRSATFNLGLLQGLHQLKLLGMFDYLATVSGGGYIGGFWTAWRHHAKEEKDPLFPSAGGRSRGTHLEAVRHLREFSNFLRPRMGLLSPDTGRMMTAALSAVIPSLLAALSLIVLALLFWFGLAWLLLVGWQSEQPLPFARLALSGAVMFLVTCALLGFLEWRLLVQDERVKKARSQSTCAKTTDTPAPARWSFPYFLGDSLLTALFVLGVWAWLLYAYHEDAWVGQGVLLNVPTLPESGLKLKERFYVFSPALAWVAAAGVLVLRRWLLSRWMMQPQSQKENAVDRIISRLLILAALWSAISAFWLTGQIMYDDMQGKSGPALAQTGFILALTALFTKVQRFFGSQVSKPVSPTWKSKAKELLPQLLAYAIIVLLVLGMVALLQPATRAEDWRWISVPLLVAGAITLFTLLFFDPNNVGLHAFYRSRIARTFIGAAHGKAPGETELHAEDDLPLDELRYKSGPFHIICCTANDLAPEDPMLNLYRGATSAVLSCKGFSVGGEGEGWEALKGRGVPVPSLAAAMTASGAALNSHMGSMSMRMGPAVTFLMTAFNLRLGLWWPHPIRERVPGKKSP